MRREATKRLSETQTLSELHDEWRDGRNTEEVLSLAIELLQRMERTRRAMVADFLRAQEQDRQRIAGYIHDEFIQAMAVVGLRLQMLCDQLADSNLKQDVQSIEEVVADAMSRLRNLIFELDPADLEAVGLGRALRTHLKQYFRGSGIAFSVRGRFSSEPPAEIRRIAFRIVHEAVVNSRKHAGASRVSVTLSGGSKGYLVTIEDDGRGFKPAAVVSSKRPGHHLGLRLMSDRAKLVGGDVTVSSVPREGTTIVVRIPADEILLLGARRSRIR